MLLCLIKINFAEVCVCLCVRACACVFNSFSLAPSITANHTNLYGNHMQFVVIYAQSEQLFLLIRQRWFKKKKIIQANVLCCCVFYNWLLSRCCFARLWRALSHNRLVKTHTNTHKNKIVTARDSNHCVVQLLHLKTKRICNFGLVFWVHSGGQKDKKVALRRQNDDSINQSAKDFDAQLQRKKKKKRRKFLTGNPRGLKKNKLMSETVCLPRGPAEMSG